MIPMSEKRLARAGFTEMSPGVWARLQVTPETASGCAVVLREGMALFGGAQFEMDAIYALCRSILDALTGTRVEQKRKAEKVLANLFQSELVVGEDGDCYCPGDPELGAELTYLVGRWRPFKRVANAFKKAGDVLRGDAKIRVDPKAWGREVKKKAKKVGASFKKFAKKVADSKVLQKLRDVVAKLMEGPVGQAAAKGAGMALQALGVPAPVTEAAVRGAFTRKADRLRKGGWSGVVSRAGGGQVLREESRRFKASARQTADTLRKQAEAALSRATSSAPGGAFGGGFSGALSNLSLAGVHEGAPAGLDYETLGRLHQSRNVYRPPVIVEARVDYERGWWGARRDRPGGIGGRGSIYELGACV